MVQHELAARDAVEDARECWERISSALDEAIGKAEQLGDDEMLARLSGVRTAADRGNELIGKLGAMLHAEEFGAARTSCGNNLPDLDALG